MRAPCADEAVAVAREGVEFSCLRADVEPASSRADGVSPEIDILVRRTGRVVHPDPEARTGDVPKDVAIDIQVVRPRNQDAVPIAVRTLPQVLDDVSTDHHVLNERLRVLAPPDGEPAADVLDDCVLDEDVLGVVVNDHAFAPCRGLQSEAVEPVFRRARAGGSDWRAAADRDVFAALDVDRVLSPPEVRRGREDVVVLDDDVFRVDRNGGVIFALDAVTAVVPDSVAADHDP